MAQRRNALGRGLGALLPDPPVSSPGTSPPGVAREGARFPAARGAPTELPIDSIVPSREHETASLSLRLRRLFEISKLGLANLLALACARARLGRYAERRRGWT